MGAQHTPGPWYHSCDEGNDRRYCNINAVPEGSDDGVIIATIEEIDDGTHDEQREANARLIAAAPILLGLLEAAVLFIEAFHATNTNELAQEARAVIAKARGQ